MANEIVKYENKMNGVSFRNFTATELDLLMTICSRMREKGTTEITFSFDHLRELSKYDYKSSNDKFVKDLMKTYDKLIDLKITYWETPSIFSRFVLFHRYRVDFEKQLVHIGTTNEFQWVLNGLTSEFTRFELEEFVNLKGKYTKDIYRLCKQYRSTGEWHIAIDKFRQLLDISQTYTMGMIDKQVLEPAIKELTEICNYFKVVKEYETKKAFVPGKTRRGRKAVTSLHFYFDFKKKDKVPVELIEDNTLSPTFQEPKVDKYRYLQKIPPQENQIKQNEYAPNVKNFEERPFQAVDEHPDYWKRFELDDEEDV